MEYKDYYQVLGVPKTATQAEIKKAYRRLARELHPDRNPGDKAAEQRFKEANEAHAVLSDPEKRKHYDELGANWQAYQQYGGGAGPFPGADWAGTAAGPGGTRFTYRRVSPEEMSGFSDFFRAFFGDDGISFGTGGPRTAARGQGQQMDSRGGARSIPLDEVYEYGDLFEPGGRSGSRGQPGRAVDAQAEASVTLAEVARGAERMVSVDGRRLQVKIPPGVAEGARVKLRGAGLRTGQGPAGDLYIAVHVQPDPRFDRHGANLTTEVPITLAEAIAGADVPVETPTGTLKLRIRPNTQNGQEIHLAGKALPRSGRDGGRGDLIVRVRVVLPHLDEAAREEITAILARHPQPDPRARQRTH